MDFFRTGTFWEFPVVSPNLEEEPTQISRSDRAIGQFTVPWRTDFRKVRRVFEDAPDQADGAASKTQRTLLI